MAIKNLLHLSTLMVLIGVQPNNIFADIEASFAVQQENKEVSEPDESFRNKRSVSVQGSPASCPNITAALSHPVECHEICNGIYDCANGFDESLEIALLTSLTGQDFGSNATCKDVQGHCERKGDWKCINQTFCLSHYHVC